MLVDLRSDTITRPGPGMLKAMANASTGDDVFGEDPTVNKLEAMIASLFGMEAALYCASGTMSNQIAIKAHTQPGDEVICDADAHIYQYEGGGIAFNAGCQVKLLSGDRGRIKASQIETAINPDDVHKAASRLVCLENTCNRGGGSCYDMSEIAAIQQLCRQRGLMLHLDGARLFNAMVAKKQAASDYGRLFDSISVCLNKGLGCPMGSVLIGSAAFIRRSRRIRKLFGGGLRQAGYMAACGVYALENNIDRLAADHAHATALAEVLSSRPFVKTVLPVETNIIIFELADGIAAKSMVAKLAEKNIRVVSMSPTRIRMVLHLDITPEKLQSAIHTLKRVE
jgi:threonine aldolase